MKSRLVLASVLILLTLLYRPAVPGQGPLKKGADRAKTKPTAAQHLPDLIIYNVVRNGDGVTSEFNESGARFDVNVRNYGAKGYESANVKGPITVWLRIWKPKTEQSLTDTEPNATSFVWGGVQTIDGLKAGETKQASFSVAAPPGGWEMGIPCGFCPYKWLKPNDSSRLRIVARVDSKSVVKESDESNNDRFLFEFEPH